MSMPHATDLSVSASGFGSSASGCVSGHGFTKRNLQRVMCNIILQIQPSRSRDRLCVQSSSIVITNIYIANSERLAVMNIEIK